MDFEKAFESNDNWAIIITAGGKYIGWLDPGMSEEGRNILHFPQEFHSSLLPRQGPGGQVVFERMIQAYSVSRCLEIEELKMEVTVSDVVYLTNMSTRDCAWHKDLIRSGIRAALEARASAAGIHPPGNPRKGFQTGNA